MIVFVLGVAATGLGFSFFTGVFLAGVFLVGVFFGAVSFGVASTIGAAAGLETSVGFYSLSADFLAGVFLAGVRSAFGLAVLSVEIA